MQFPGWIALDIDGTSTFDAYTLPEKLIVTLRKLHEKKWKIAFVTGRTTRFARMPLDHLGFSYLLVPQNGTLAIELPEKKIFFTSYLPFEELVVIDEILKEEGLDLVVYLGAEANDLCYFRKKQFPPETVRIIEEWQQRQKEVWREVVEFDREEIPFFAAIKSYASIEKIEKVCQKLKEKTSFSVSYVRDLYNKGSAILFITHPLASKGQALLKLFSFLGRGEKVIVAGDDDNDSSLFEIADFSIAMGHAPDFLKKRASLILESDLADSLWKEANG